MKKDRVQISFEVLFCNIKALVRERDGAMHKSGGEKKGREDDRDAEETAPFSSGFDVG